jgi:malonate-semialdehyde dehydrogenase (acetylating)/methylmalonate-semialdehyde dehydrogenase
MKRMKRLSVAHRWILSTKTRGYSYDTSSPWLISTDDTIPKITNFINGAFVPSKANTFLDVTNPATNEVISRVPIT